LVKNIKNLKLLISLILKNQIKKKVNYDICFTHATPRLNTVSHVDRWSTTYLSGGGAALHGGAAPSRYTARGSPTGRPVAATWHAAVPLQAATWHWAPLCVAALLAAASSLAGRVRRLVTLHTIPRPPLILFPCLSLPHFKFQLVPLQPHCLQSCSLVVPSSIRSCSLYPPPPSIHLPVLPSLHLHPFIISTLSSHPLTLADDFCLIQRSFSSPHRAIAVLAVWLCHLQVSVLASCPVGSAAGSPPPSRQREGTRRYTL
jgi:hypothetical protein